MTIKFKKLNPEALLPRYMREGDAGMDICSVEDKVIKAGEYALVGTGLAVELPLDIEAQVRPRSGLALKYGVTLLNSPGTIDSNYRGEIGVIMVNHGKADFHVEKGMRVAQLIISKVCVAEIAESENLTETIRNEKGFGSSGLKG